MYNKTKLNRWLDAEILPRAFFAEKLGLKKEAFESLIAGDTDWTAEQVNTFIKYGMTSAEAMTIFFDCPETDSAGSEPLAERRTAEQVPDADIIPLFSMLTEEEKGIVLGMVKGILATHEAN